MRFTTALCWTLWKAFCLISSSIFMKRKKAPGIHQGLVSDSYSGFVHFNLADDVDIIGDDKFTTCQPAVPLQVVVFAVDGSIHPESGLYATAGIYCAAVGNVKDHRFGYITHGEVALQFIGITFLYKLPFEFNFRKFFGIEDVVLLQVVITTFVLCINRGNLCSELHIGVMKVVAGAGDFGIEVCKLAFHLRYRHVNDVKANAGVRLVNSPGGLCERRARSEQGDQ